MKVICQECDCEMKSIVNFHGKGTPFLCPKCNKRVIVLLPFEYLTSTQSEKDDYPLPKKFMSLKKS